MVDIAAMLRLVLLLLVFLVPGIAHADACKDRFVSFVADGNGERTTVLTVKQTIKGQKPTINRMSFKSRTHWLNETVEPKGGPSYMLSGNTMYQSNDGGTSWSKISTFDQAATDAAMAQQRADAEAGRDFVCDTVEENGKKFERVSGTYDVTSGFKNTQHHTYWFDPALGMIVRSRYETKATGFESLVEQEAVPVDDLALPTP